MNIITRRTFLKSIAAFVASAALPIPAFSSLRSPYVAVGEVVNYIGPHPGGFLGGRVVDSIGEWDGAGYPVTLFTNSFPSQKENGFYDVDLSCFLREIPPRFWARPDVQHYPNVHTWIRVQRYGESFEQAIRKLNLTLAGRNLLLGAC